MLTEAKSYLKLFFLYAKLNLSSFMEYRLSFIIQIIFMALNNTVYLFFWAMLFTKTSLIGGYTLKDFMFIWAIGPAAFGLQGILLGNAWDLHSIIVDGNLDSYIIQPKSVLFNVLFSKSFMGSWGDFVFGIILYFIFYGFEVYGFILFMIFVITGAVVIASVGIIASSLTFYWGNSSAITGLSFDSLITMITYPEGLFKGLFKFIIYTILPGGFIVFIPLKIFKHFDIKLTLLLLISDLGYFLLAHWFFNKGLKRYESGNLITTKL